MNHFSSLRFRLQLLVLIAIIPVLGMTLYKAAEDRQREMSRIQATALQMAQTILGEEQQLIRGTRQLLVVLAQLAAVRDGDPKVCAAFLADLVSQIPRYANLGVMDLDGNLSCSALPASGPVDVSDHLSFQDAIATRDFSVGDYHIDRVTNKPTISLAYPILDEAGQAQAVVFAALDLDWFNQLELGVTAQLPKGATLLSVDSHGVVLTCAPGPEGCVGRSMLEVPLVQTVLDREQGVMEAVGPDGMPGIYAFAAVPSALYARNIHIIAGFSRDAAFGDANKILARNLVGLGLVTVLALVTASVWGNAFIQRPVKVLLHAASRLSGGNLSARTGIDPGQGELAQLARVFDQMAEALEQHEAERRRAEETLREYAERLRMLHEMDGAILMASSSEAIAQAVVNQIRELVPCVWASVVTFDLETHRAKALAIYTEAEIGADMGGDDVLSDAVHLLAMFGDIEELGRGKVHTVEDISISCQQPSVIQALQALGVRSYIDLPLISRGHLVGVLSLGRNDLGTFAREHVEIAREVADSLAIAVQNARLLELVHAGRERLMALSHRLMGAQETERRHIARELHDEIGQALTVVKINLQAAQRVLDKAALVPYLEESISVVERTLQQVRDLSLDLRPSLLDDLGLVPSLRWLVARHARQGGLSVEFVADSFDQRLSPDPEIVCFRLVQEALTNVVRHSQAQHLYVELRQCEGEVHLTIRDDGVGFDVQAAIERAVHGASLGLLGMRERALLVGGQIDIESTPGRGTEIRVRFLADQRGGQK